MFTFLLTLHILVSILLILIVLLQAGKGAGLANIFGGGAGSIFGPSTSVFISRLTSIIAAIFMLTSLYLSLIAHERYTHSLLKRAVAKEKVVPQGK